MASTTTTTEDRALALLGSGVSAEATAAALGVDPSRISQLLAQEEFAAQVAELKFKNLQQHNERDNSYDRLEDKLIQKLEKSLPLMLRPGEILKAIQVVNGAKRRGQSSTDQVRGTQTVVNIILPTKITQKFVKNVDNQVIKAGEQELITIPSGTLLDRTENKTEDRASEQNSQYDNHTKQIESKE